MVIPSLSRGFTLLEMVITMVVSTLLILGIAGFIELGAKGYVDSVDRQRVQTQAKFVLEKMAREIRHSIPNLLSTERQTGAQSCLNFYPIDYSGFYTLSGADLLFVLGEDESPTNIIDVGQSLIINPARIEDVNNAISLRSENTSVSGAVVTILGGAQLISSDSVAKRVYLFDNPVSYCVVPSVQYSRLYRIENGQTLPLSGDIVSQSEFRYDQTDLRSGGLVHVELGLTQRDELSRYQQDIQVLNVP